MATLTTQDVRDRILGRASAIRSPVSSYSRPSRQSSHCFFATLSRVETSLKQTPADTKTIQRVKTQSDAVAEVQAGTKPFTDLGGVLASPLSAAARRRSDGASVAFGSTGHGARHRAIGHASARYYRPKTRQLLSARPDVTAIMDDLTAVKTLRGRACRCSRVSRLPRAPARVKERMAARLR